MNLRDHLSGNDLFFGIRSKFKRLHGALLDDIFDVNLLSKIINKALSIKSTITYIYDC